MTESSPQAAQQAEAKALVVKEGDVLLVNRDGVDYKVSFDQVVDSLPIPGLEQVVMSGDTSGWGIHCDGAQSTFMGAGIKANIVRCESVSYFDERMYAKGGINVGNHIYFADEYDEWNSDDQGQISNVYRIQFGDYKDEGKATDISKVENIFFKSGDEYSDDSGGMISGCNALYLSRNEETDYSTQISGLTKLYFTDNLGTNDAYEGKAELTGLSRLFVNANFDSNIVSQLPELPVAR